MVVVTRAGRLREWSQGEFRLYYNVHPLLQVKGLLLFFPLVIRQNITIFSLFLQLFVTFPRNPAFHSLKLIFLTKLSWSLNFLNCKAKKSDSRRKNDLCYYYFAVSNYHN